MKHVEKVVGTSTVTKTYKKRRINLTYQTESSCIITGESTRPCSSFHCNNYSKRLITKQYRQNHVIWPILRTPSPLKNGIHMIRY